MKTRNIADLMIPLANYATVNQDASLVEAVVALEEAQKRQHHHHHPHRAVLVHDDDGQIVGKLSMLDVLRALEPQYEKIGDFSHSMRFGFSAGFIKSMAKTYNLWQKPLDDLCRRAAKITVKDIMYTPAEGEFVKFDANLDEAVHQLVIGHHQSLLVTDEKKKVVGILRLADVFSEICRLMKSTNS